MQRYTCKCLTLINYTTRNIQIIQLECKYVIVNKEMRTSFVKRVVHSTRTTCPKPPQSELPLSFNTMPFIDFTPLLLRTAVFLLLTLWCLSCEYNLKLISCFSIPFLFSIFDNFSELHKFDSFDLCRAYMRIK